MLFHEEHHILELEARKVTTGVAVPQGLLDTATFDIHQEVADGLLISLTDYVLSDHLATDQKVVFSKRPATWWQHTKAVHFPTFSRWLRRPPRYVHEEVVVEVQSFATFPESTISYPKELGADRKVQIVTQRPLLTWQDEPL